MYNMFEIKYEVMGSYQIIFIFFFIKALLLIRSQWNSLSLGTDQNNVNKKEDKKRGYEHGWIWETSWGKGWEETMNCALHTSMNTSWRSIQNLCNAHIMVSSQHNPQPKP